MNCRRIPIALSAILLIGATRAEAQAPARVTAGAIVWTGDTDLKVDSATDWDGTSRTVEESSKAWNTMGSGTGVRIGYDFPRLFSIYGEGGVVQTTVRSRDLANSNVVSRGMDTGGFYGAGLRVGADMKGSPMFWSAGADVRRHWADLHEDPDHFWSYDETNFGANGRIGTRLHSVGAYFGLRVGQLTSDLQQTDRTQLPGFQVRDTNLKRDEQMDLLLGAQTGAGSYSGFAELAFVGTTTATAGVSVRF